LLLPAYVSSGFHALGIGSACPSESISYQNKAHRLMTDHHERAPRKNLFLAGSIESGPLKAQVRIRNMSGNGAMLEGAALPATGSLLTLKRGDLEIGGTVAWSHAGRCGVRLDGMVYLDEWVAGKRLPTKGATLSGQTRVDSIQAAIRLGWPRETFSEEEEPPTGPSTPLAKRDLPQRIGLEIATVQRVLVANVDAFSDDPLMLARYGSQLQALQSAAELLDHLARVLLAPDAEAAVADISLHALRSRLLGKPLF
jgi:hypothetical protein